MKIAGLIRNDVVNGYDVCVSVWVQGCPFHCEGCHNPQTWNFDGGIEVEEDEFIEEVIESIKRNGVQRNLSLLGGEPLCKQNYPFVKKLIMSVREKYPRIKVFIWTGYRFEDLSREQLRVVTFADTIVDGQFELANRDITLPFRGSSNQRIIDVKKTLETGSIVETEKL